MLRTRLSIQVLLIFAIFASCSAAAGSNEKHGAYMPDIDRLHDRLHDHSGEGPKRQFDSDVVPIETVEPEYPREALIQCRRGWVLLEFMVTEEGEVEDVEVLAQDSSRLFDRAARRALSRWRFKPAMIDGKPVTRGATIPLEFSRPKGCLEEPPEMHEASLSGWLNLPVHSAESVEHAEIVLVPIVSRLLGKPDGYFVHGQLWFKGDDLTVHFDSMADDLVFQLKDWDDMEGNDGLVLQPSDARFARIMPIAERQDDEKEILDSYLTDAQGRDLVLVYADRKASLTGRRQLGKTPLDYSLEFPGAGFYWAEFRVNSDKTAYEVILTEPEKPRLVMQEFEE